MATKKRASWAPNVVVEKGLDALDFATENAADLTPRLAAGVIEGLTADLGAVGAKFPAVLQRRLAAGAATEVERSSAARSKKLLGKIRRALLSAPAGLVDRKTWGLGLRVDDRINKTVIAAAGAVKEAAAAQPDVVRAAGILPADLTRLEQGMTELAGSDAAQGDAKRTSARVKRDLDAALVRIEQAVRSISSAGDLAYDGDPREKRALALIPAAKKPKKVAAPA